MIETRLPEVSQLIPLAEAFLSDFQEDVRNQNLKDLLTYLASGKVSPAPNLLPEGLSQCRWSPARSVPADWQTKKNWMTGGFFTANLPPTSNQQSISRLGNSFAQWNHQIAGKMAVIGVPEFLKTLPLTQIAKLDCFQEAVYQDLLNTLIRENLRSGQAEVAHKLDQAVPIQGFDQQTRHQPLFELKMEADQETENLLSNIENALLVKAKDWFERLLSSGEAEMAQAILPFNDSAAARPFLSVGFSKLADLVFLASPNMEELDLGAEPEDLDFQIQPVDGENFDRWSSILQKTYLHSKDAPELTGKRSTLQTLIGYCHTGSFIPEGWGIVCGNPTASGSTRSAEDLGCVILCEHQNSSYLELVYFGVSAEARGRSVGKAIFRFIHETAKKLGKERVIAAVDLQNRPALNIYDFFQYQHFDQKSVLVAF